MTTVYNVHIGLTAWAAGAVYTAGQRRSNGGNAYEVTVGGTSAGAGGPSGTGSSIVDNGVTWKYLSAIDYASLTAVNAAVAALTAAFTTTVQFKFWNDGQISAAGGWGGSSVAAQPIYVPSGLGASIVNRLQFLCAPGESWADHGSIAINPSASAGVLFSQTTASSFSMFVYVQNPYVDFDGFQFTSADSAGGIFTNIIYNDAGNSDMRITRCLFDGYSYDAGAGALVHSDQGATATNTVFIERSSAGSTSATAADLDNGNVGGSIVNCTIYSPNNTTGRGVYCNFTTGFVIENCVVIGPAAPIGGGFNGVVSVNNAVSAANYSGSNVFSDTGSIFSQTAAATFSAPASDLRLKAGAPSINAGATAGGVYPDTANDVFGTARPQGASYDIGAFEYASAAAANSNFMLMFG